jgi:hypothetical protein
VLCAGRIAASEPNAARNTVNNGRQRVKVFLGWLFLGWRGIRGDAETLAEADLSL